MTRDPRIEVQRRVHALFTQKFASGEPITKEEVQAITQWKPKTLNTYWSKQFRSILAQRPDGRYRVTESFRNYSDFKRFRDLVTQVKISDPNKPPAAPDYTLLQHDHVLIYEFFTPLTNEMTLKQSLDRLFYRTQSSAGLGNLTRRPSSGGSLQKATAGMTTTKSCATGYPRGSRATR